MESFIPRVVNIQNKRAGEVWIFDTIRIDRTTPWGNPYIMGIDGDTREEVVTKYINWLDQWLKHKTELVKYIGIRKYSNKYVIENILELREKNLACWCSPDSCHGDILLVLANQ